MNQFGSVPRHAFERPTAALSTQRALVERDVATALTQADPTLVFRSETFEQMLLATMTEKRRVAMVSGFFGGTRDTKA